MKKIKSFRHIYTKNKFASDWQKNTEREGGLLERKKKMMKEKEEKKEKERKKEERKVKGERKKETEKERRKRKKN